MKPPATTADDDLLWIAGYPVLRTSPAALTERLLEALARDERQALLFANTNFAVQCAELRPRLTDAGILIANDGLGMDLAARLVHGRRFHANLNGTDFVPALVSRAACPVFLFGGRPGIAERAAQALRRAGCEVAGVCDGYAGAADEARLAAEIDASGARIVLVALGNPRQERWILEHRERLAAPLLVGVGALLDFLAGDKPRAPRWMRRSRLEWLYRLGLEPRRLARRYTVDLVVFLALCLARRSDDAAPRAR